jgi:hypothetical protein
MNIKLQTADEKDLEQVLYHGAPFLPLGFFETESHYVAQAGVNLPTS